MAVPRVFKFALLSLGSALLLLVAVFFVAGPTVLEKVLAYADEVSQKSTGRSLTFSAPPSISLMPLGVRFEGVRWGDEASDLSFSARGGYASVNLGSILSGVPQIEEVHLEGPVIHYRQSAGQAAKSFEQKTGAEDSQQGSEPAGQGTQSLPVQLSRLVMQDGRVVVDMASGDKVTLSGIHLSVRDIGTNKAGDVKCDFVAAMQKVSGEYMEANLALQGSVDMKLPQVHVSGLQFTVSPIAGLYDKKLGPASLNFAGSYALDTQAFKVEKCEVAIPHAKAAISGAGSLKDMLAFEGDLALDASPGKMNQGLNGVQHLTLRGKTIVRDTVVEVPSFTASLDKMQAQGNLLAGGEPLQIKGSLHCDTLDVNALMGSSQAKSEAADKRKAAASAEQEPASASTSLPVVNLSLACDTILYNGVRLGKVQCTVSGKEGRYAITPLKATIDGSGVLDGRADINLPDKSWRTSGSIRNLALSTVQKAAGQDFGMAGSGNLQWNLRAQGSDSREIAETASGKGQIALSNVTIAGITRAIRNTKQLASVVVPERIDRVTVPFTLADGHCRWQASLDSKGLEGTGQGDVNYLAKRIDATAEVRVQGRTIPLKIHGPLSDISYSVDVEKLMKNMGRQLLETPRNAQDGVKSLVPRGGNLLKGLF